ncbi:hypothetical protein D3C78_811340 [compost metagenome]
MLDAQVVGLLHDLGRRQVDVRLVAGNLDHCRVEYPEAHVLRVLRDVHTLQEGVDLGLALVGLALLLHIAGDLSPVDLAFKRTLVLVQFVELSLVFLRRQVAIVELVAQCGLLARDVGQLRLGIFRGIGHQDRGACWLFLGGSCVGGLFVSGFLCGRIGGSFRVSVGLCLLFFRGQGLLLFLFLFFRRDHFVRVELGVVGFCQLLVELGQAGDLFFGHAGVCRVVVSLRHYSPRSSVGGGVA